MEQIIINNEQIKDLSFKSPLNFKQEADFHRKLSKATRLKKGYHTKIAIIF